MTEIKVKRGKTIQAELRVPGDKSISHRAVLFAALSNGPCVIRGFLPSEDCRHMVAAVRQLGVRVDEPSPTTLVVHGRKMSLEAPANEIDCGNSGTAMRLLAGVLAGQPFTSRLIGDASLSRRPMRRIMEPLERMGAKITAEGEGGTAPLVIEGGSLKPLEYEMPVASAQVKSAVLLAGLFAKGKTVVIEPMTSRDHTERMLKYFLVDTESNGNRISVLGRQVPESRDFIVPGDISSAAFWMAAAAAQPGSRLLIEDVGLNDTRTAILGVLIRMGAHVHEVIEELDQIESMGTVEVRGAELHATEIGGREIPNLIDEIPILSVVAALASGTTRITGARELRVKESDRIATVAANLQAMGVEVRELDDGMEIVGRAGERGAPLKGARLQSHGDHRVAMAFAVAGLFASGETIIEDADCVETSYPGFSMALQHLASPRSAVSYITPAIGPLRAPVEEMEDEK